MQISFCDESELGFGWIVAEFMERCSHALVDRGRVWLVDPVLGEGIEERTRAAGEPAGVIQLLDRHRRDCAELAQRLGVPHHEVPFDGVPGSPFEVIAVRRRRRWQEVALWWPERRVLVCADAVGTARYYRAGDERLAVNPLLRLTPPLPLAQIQPGDDPRRPRRGRPRARSGGAARGACHSAPACPGACRELGAQPAPGSLTWHGRRQTERGSATMKLEGIHHITAITGDAPRNVDFYARVLGLRLVKKTVNQDDPTVYHLFYADELGSAGSDITFFEYPGARRGRPGAGMVHRVAFRVGSAEALDFWAERLGAEGVETERDGTALRFADPEEMGLELRAVETADEPLVANHPEIPRELALQGFDGARAYALDPERSRRFLEGGLGFAPHEGDEYECRGDRRGSLLRLRPLRRARLRRRRHGAPHRLGVADRRARGLAAARAGCRRGADAGDRPLLLQVDLLPRAERRALRDRHDRPGLHCRRAAGDARRAALAAARRSSICATRSSRC